jgi:hypothetical protein
VSKLCETNFEVKAVGELENKIYESQRQHGHVQGMIHCRSSTRDQSRLAAKGAGRQKPRARTALNDSKRPTPSTRYEAGMERSHTPESFDTSDAKPYNPMSIT